jgi:carbon storage regulator CsrA
MLVLTRKKDEQIRIGEDIIITVIRVKGKSVRLGIQAPRTEPVLRGELEFREPAGANFTDELASAVTICSAACQSDATTAPRIAKRPLRNFLSARAMRKVSG